MLKGGILLKVIVVGYEKSVGRKDRLIWQKM